MSTSKKPVKTAPKTSTPQNNALEFGKAWDYAPAPEASDYLSISKQHQLFVGGGWQAPTSKKYYDTINPATEAVLSSVAEANAADVDLAVRAARTAGEKYWFKMPGKERAKYIYRIARVLQERAREFAVLETLNNGKPIKESRDFDVPQAAAHFFYHAGWADKLDLAFQGRSTRPVGVVGQIIPWNFPLLMCAWKLAPALACGNTVVLKPSETTPLTALLLAKLLEDIDLPPGVVNIVTGAGATGAAMVAHAGINKIAFTGSTAVGKGIQRALAGTGKRLTLELGGKAANIVFEDAALDQAVEGIVAGIFFNQGQVCCAGSRLLVEESIQEPLLRRLRDRMASLRVGDPMDKNTDVGAINSAAQLGRVRDLVAAGVAEGATLYSAPTQLPKKGFYHAPTLLENATPTMRVVREEIFGPVLTVSSFRTPDEAVEKANNTNYGLSAGVWTEKGSKSFAIAGKLKAGVVWANTFNKFDPSSPFGGFKESGFGREGGRQGLAAYVEVR